MTVSVLLWLLTALTAKHFLCDFGLQTAWIAANKGRWGHPASVVHSGEHALATLAVLWVFGLPLPVVAGIAAVEFAVHYHIDCAKDAITRRLGLTTDDRGFWIALGLDQSLHQMTYLVIVTAVA